MTQQFVRLAEVRLTMPKNALRCMQNRADSADGTAAEILRGQADGTPSDQARATPILANGRTLNPMQRLD
jgi:hypothetical protein